MAQAEAAAPSSGGVSSVLAALDAAMSGSPISAPAPAAPAQAAPAPAPAQSAPPPAAQPTQAPQYAPQALPPQQTGITPAAPQPPAGPAAGQPGTPTPAPAQNAQAQEEPPLVPSFRVREETEKRRNAETYAEQMRGQNIQLMATLEAILAAQPQQQAQPAQPQAPAQPQLPDLIDDPVAYAAAVKKMAEDAAKELVAQQTAPLQKQMTEQRLDSSWERAVSTHGQEVASAATKAAKEAGLQDRFMATADPVGEAVTWYNRQLAAQQFGTDPATIKSRVEQQLMQNPAYLEQLLNQARAIVAQAQGTPPPQAQPAAPQVVAPPSFAGQPRAQGAVPPGTVVRTADAVNAMFADRKAQWNAPPGQRAF